MLLCLPPEVIWIIYLIKPNIAIGSISFCIRKGSFEVWWVQLTLFSLSPFISAAVLTAAVANIIFCPFLSFDHSATHMPCITATAIRGKAASLQPKGMCRLWRHPGHCFPEDEDEVRTTLCQSEWPHRGRDPQDGWHAIKGRCAKGEWWTKN